MTLYVNVLGDWKEVSIPYVKIDDDWKEVKTIWEKTGGIWKEIIDTYTYVWTDGEGWGECSVTCGTGTQSRTPECTRVEDGSIVDDSKCSGETPLTSTRDCNTQACTDCRYISGVSATCGNISGSAPRCNYWMPWNGQATTGSICFNCYILETYVTFGNSSVTTSTLRYEYGGYMYARGAYQESYQGSYHYYTVCRSPINAPTFSDSYKWSANAEGTGQVTWNDSVVADSMDLSDTSVVVGVWEYERSTFHITLEGTSFYAVRRYPSPDYDHT